MTRSAEATHTRQAQSTILVVEDSPTQAIHLQSLLERSGVHVMLASDGPQGIELAQTTHPDLIVLDMQLPRMNGLEVLERLKRDHGTGEIPVIVLTRHDDPETIALGLQAGVVDYIPKDAFADAVLLETLRQMGLITWKTAQ